LQRKYSRQIEIDVDAFDAIELTGIDLIALQKNVPFAVVVPAFPQLTSMQISIKEGEWNRTTASCTV
jgi:hypothetical protein